MISSNWRIERIGEGGVCYCSSVPIRRLAGELILDCYFACARCTPKHSALWGQFPPDPHSRLPNHVFAEVNSTTPTRAFRAKYLFISVPLVRWTQPLQEFHNAAVTRCAIDWRITFPLHLLPSSPIVVNFLPPQKCYQRLGWGSFYSILQSDLYKKILVFIYTF